MFQRVNEFIQIASKCDIFINNAGIKAVVMTLPVTGYLGNKFSKKFLDNHVMRYIEQANKDYDCPTLFYLKGNKFKDKDLYFNSFFMNAKGRNLFIHEVVKELRDRRIL